MRSTIFLVLISVLLLSLAACATPAQTGTAVTAAATGFLAYAEALSPFLPPETLAKLQMALANVDGSTQAISAALHTVAEGIAAMKSSSAAAFAEHGRQIAEQAASVASLPSRSEVYLAGTGTGTASVAVSRVLSMLKHGVARPAAAAKAT